MPPLVACSLLLGAALPWPSDGERELERIAKLPAAEACPRLEELLDRRDLDAAARCTALTRLRDLALAAAAPPSPAEAALVEELKARSLPVAEPLVSRYAIVLGSQAFLDAARAQDVGGLLDASYVVLRQLFGLDPVQIVGRRYVFFPEAAKPGGWTIQSASLTVAYGNVEAQQGGWYDDMAHELSHGFTWRHPARHLIAGGFGEGWSDLAIAYVSERLRCLGGDFEQRWNGWRDGILAGGETEYLKTRLPIEEIIGYAPSVSVALRLCLDAGARPDDSIWDPLAELFRSSAREPPPWMPGHLWPARMARDFLRAFPGERTWDTLSRWRFPLDAGSQKEIDAWTARARQKPVPSRAEQWKADAQTVVGTWRVLGPIAVPQGRWPNVDYDPADAWNFVERDGLDVAGVRHPWRTDVPVDADGIVQLASLPGADSPCVAYLRADLPPEAEGPVTLHVAGDDECAVWLDGTLVDLYRGERGTNPDDPDRAFARVAKGGGRILVQVANYGGPTGFHLRWSKGTPFETSWKVELRAPDPRRRLMAVRRVGSLRAPAELVLPLLGDALGDGSPEVRAEAARFLGGRRGDARAIDELTRAFGREKEAAVSAALRAALGELALREFLDAAEAHRWWRDEGRTWRAADHREAELAYALRSVFGGFYANHAGAYGGQHVGRCFGGDPAHELSLVLEAKQSGPHVLAIRYASADGERRADVRVRRGEQPVTARDGIVLPKTESWESWAWQEVPLGVLPPGRYRVAISKVDGCLDLDVLGLRPARP